MRRLRNQKGEFIKQACPECGGTLVEDGPYDLRCDDLIDPEDVRKELEACLYKAFGCVHEPYNNQPTTE